jgi:glycosyltransferase involved in cell wall biosynthesis
MIGAIVLQTNPLNQPLRVAHLISGLGRGGAETSLLRLILDTRGTLQHHVVCMTDGNELVGAIEDAGARVTVLGATRGVPNPILLPSATRALLAESPNVVHAWMWHAAALSSMCRISARIRSIPCVWGIRSSLDSGRRSLSTRIAIACARASSSYPHAIMFNSQRSHAQHALAGFCMEHSSVIHNGVDVPDEQDIAHWRRTIRAQIGVTDDMIVFVQVGRAHPDKGIGNFIKAAQIVHTQFGARAVFIRVGKPGWESGESGANIALERSPLIYHAGEQLNARPWLAAADVCAMTSLRESCPNVVLEAMSVGTPVVATDVGDAALIVGECGWVVQPNTPVALAEAMIAAASTIVQPIHRARLSKDCRTVMASQYSREEVARKQVAIYQGVIKPR